MVVAVIPNLDKYGSVDVVEKLGKILKNEQIDAFVPDNICATGFNHLSEDELYKKADLIITIGGDGTIIRYAKRAALDNKPVLGINAGRMGYLANIEQNELGLISKLKTKEYFIEKRMMLSVSIVENGKVSGTDSNVYLLEVRAYDMASDLTIAVGGASCTYNLDNYYTQAVQSADTLYDLVCALKSYCVGAKAYMAAK